MELAIESLYIDENTFYVLIDVAVKGVSSDMTTVFVRPSGHPPTTLDKTWLTSDGERIFKQIQSLQIKVEG